MIKRNDFGINFLILGFPLAFSNSGSCLASTVKGWHLVVRTVQASKFPTPEPGSFSSIVSPIASLGAIPSGCPHRIQFVFIAKGKGWKELDPENDEESIYPSSMPGRWSKFPDRNGRFGLFLGPDRFKDCERSVDWVGVIWKTNFCVETGSLVVKNVLETRKIALEGTFYESVPVSFVHFQKRESIHIGFSDSNGESANKLCFVFFDSVKKFVKAPDRNSGHFTVEGNAMENGIDGLEWLRTEESSTSAVQPCLGRTIRDSRKACLSQEKVK
jgi:hypothetical protein